MKIAGLIKILCALFASVLLSNPLLAQTIIYDTTGLAGNEIGLPATSVPTGFTATDVTRVNAIPRNGANGFNSRSWNPNGDSPGDSYLQWTINLGTGTYDIDAMHIGFRRSNRGPRDYELQVSVDAGMSWVTVFTEINLSVSVAQQTGVDGIAPIDLSLIPAVSGDVMFRFFGSNSVGSNGTMRLRSVNGDPSISITAVASLVPVITSSKEVLVFSEDGSSCANLGTASVIPIGLGAATPGACIEYTVEIENTGSAAATNLVVTDNMPSNMIFIAAERLGWDETSLSPDTFSFSTPAAGANCGMVPCVIQVLNGIVQDGTTASFRVRALID